MYWCPLNLQRNGNMLNVIDIATPISCYFILSMDFIDNICAFSANIKSICTNFRNRGRKKMFLCRAVPSCFEMSTNTKLISGHCINVRHVCKSYTIYTLKGKKVGHCGWISQSNVYSAVYARPVYLALRPTHDSDYVCV